LGEDGRKEDEGKGKGRKTEGKRKRGMTG